MRTLILGLAIVLAPVAWAQDEDEGGQNLGLSWNPRVLKLLQGDFEWRYAGPFLGPANRPDDPGIAVTDPSLVRHEGKWHLFCTIRGPQRPHQIEYASFEAFSDAASAPRQLLKLSDGDFGGPQAFYFAPQRKWYLLHHATDPSRRPAIQPAISTNDDIARPDAWSRPVLLFDKPPANVTAWTGFWIICDEDTAYLFFTSRDGRLWRSATKLADFPRGWMEPKVVLKADIYGGCRIYHLKGLRRYLALADGQDGGRRHVQAFITTRLDGSWRALADARATPFAGKANAQPVEGGAAWADSIGRGELLRLGADQNMDVDPLNLRLVFQGVSDQDRAGKGYGQIPWRLGLLEPQ